MWGACPTLFDPTQAPPGKHMAFMWEKLPYARCTANARTGIARKDNARQEHAGGLVTHSLRIWRKAAVWTGLFDHRWIRNAVCRTCDKATSWSARSPTARSATIGRLPVQVSTERLSPGLYLCGGSRIPEETSRGCADTTQPPSWRPTWDCRRWWQPRSAESALGTLAV